MYKHTKRFLIQYLRGKGYGYFWGIFFLLITILTTTSIPLVIKDAINLLDDNLKSNLSQNKKLLYTSILILVMGIILSLARAFSRILIFLQGRKIEAEIRQNFYNAVISMPLDTLANYQSGDLISRGTNDVTSVRVMISMGILHSVNTSLVLAFCFYHMFSISWKLTLICLIPLPLAILGSKFLSRKMMQAGKESQQKLGILSEKIREQFKAHTLLSIFPVFETINKQFEIDNLEYSTKSESLLRIRVFVMVLIATILGLGLYILLRFGGAEAISNQELGRNGFNIGAFTAFSLFLGIMQGPLRAAGFLFPLLQRGEICLEKIYQIIDAATDAKAIDAKRKYQKKIPENEYDDNLISFENLHFHYPSNPQSFNIDIKHLKFQKGKKYGIFGKTGSGKTTLVNIICGNLRTDGIFFKNIAYKDIATDLLNQQISLVPQENKHFSKTIQQNLDLVINNIEHNGNCLNFQDSYSISQLETDIANFNDGLDTLLGEHGINLSGGQKQRLSILRALVKPCELLIMDDYVSAVDHKTEAKIIAALTEKCQNHSMVLISHRISALTFCDQILIMDNGRIIDSGTHQELCKKNSFYRETNAHQISESLLEELQ